MTDEWQPIETAPKDGSTIQIPIKGQVPAYWDEELKTWVLVWPQHPRQSEQERYIPSA
jgi:hypothetical protein